MPFRPSVLLLELLKADLLLQQCSARGSTLRLPIKPIKQAAEASSTARIATKFFLFLFL